MKKNKFLLPLMTATFSLGAVLPTVGCNKGQIVKATSIEISNKPELPYIKLEAQKPQYKFEAKVLPENATEKTVKWELNYDGVAEGETKAQATIDQEGNITFTSNGWINVVAKTTDGTELSTENYNVYCYTRSERRTALAYDFYYTGWDKICGKSLTELRDLMGMTADETFVGLIKPVKIGSMTHWVRVVGENHDTLADGTTAVLTFESYEVYSIPTNHEREFSIWNTSGTNNYDYTTSVLRANLEGSAFEETLGEKRMFNKDLYDLITNDSDNAGLKIKKAKKHVSKKESGGDWSVGEYETYIFPLTAKEMNVDGAVEEGTAYTYYTDAYTPNIIEGLDEETIQGRRIKYSWDKIGENPNLRTYWLASPNTNTINTIYTIGTKGASANTTNIAKSGSIAVAFAFCI